MHLFYQSNVTMESSRQADQQAKRTLNKRIALTSRLKKFMIALLIVMLLLPGTIYAVSSMSSEDGGMYSESFEYVVSKGDTLWAIAAQYAPHKMDIRDYIETIRKANALETSMLTVGQRLELP